MDFTFSEQLHYLIHFVDGEYVAHCLDLDLVGSGGTKPDAVTELNMAVTSLVYYVLRNQAHEAMENIKQAPKRYWDMFEEAKRSGSIETGTLEIDPSLAPVMVQQCHFRYCLAMAA